MDEKVRQDLLAAFAGEAKAVLRLLAFADQAREEGYLQMANLFKAIAFSEEVHALNALRRLGGIKGTEENLAASFESETRIAEVAYGQFIRDAEEAGDSLAALHFAQSRDVEATHGRLYKEALDHLVNEKETDYFVCGICGYVSDQILPEACPVCGAPAQAFVRFPAPV